MYTKKELLIAIKNHGHINQAQNGVMIIQQEDNVESPH